MSPTKVNATNFVRAETDRMFAGIQLDAGAVNAFEHNRAPAPIDKQTVIRFNRDTLYSFAVTDISAGADTHRAGNGRSLPIGDDRQP